MSDVIMFVFAGRRENMELQLPFIWRILGQHPEVEYHVWNLARNDEDYEYNRSIRGERIIVHDHLFGLEPWRRFNHVYRHYAQDEYRDRIFVKLDDDVVFIETGRFGAYLDAIRAYPDYVTSAKIINNGACTLTEPNIWNAFAGLHIPLLDVHLHASYALMSHNYFFKRWNDLVDQPIRLISNQDWLSINLIGYNWHMGKRIHERLGGKHPRAVAGRHFRPFHRVGDEGMVNTLPRMIMQGFLACHLYFGPQVEGMVDALPRLRRQYAEIGDKYLEIS